MNDLSLFLECLAITYDANLDASSLEQSLGRIINPVLVKSHDYLLSLTISRLHRILAKSTKLCSLCQTDYLSFLANCRKTNAISLLLPFLQPSNLPISALPTICEWPELIEYLSVAFCLPYLQPVASQSMVNFVSRSKSFSPPTSSFDCLESEAVVRTDSIQIADDATIIEAGAFAGASSLRQVLMTARCRVERIGSRAFERSGLMSIFIPERVTVIEKRAFAGCSVLERVEFARLSVLDRICKEAFLETAVRELCFPSAVQKIAAKAFLRCGNLESVLFAEHSRLAIVGKKAFAHTMIAALAVPQSVIVLETKAFAHNVALSRLEFSENASLEKISIAAFAVCPIKTVTIPASVRHIGDRAFARCTALTTVTFGPPSRVEKIGSEAFAGCSIESISIPPRLLVLELDVFAECPLKRVDIAIDSRLRRIAPRALANCAISRF
jgi:hypothetical protein